MVVVGTKAQLVKMAPVILALEQHGVPYKFVLTGQHKETMSDLIADFGLPSPHLVLVDQGESDSPMGLLAWFVVSFFRMLRNINATRNVAGIVVHGDTMSALWGSILGWVRRIPVYHVEAGLRSFNLWRPFPEEIVRILVTWTSNTLFAPGQWAVDNLSRYKGKHVVNTVHNTLMDSLRFALQKNVEAEQVEPYLVVSVHRTENVLSKGALQEIVSMIVQIAALGKIKFVLHPITKKNLQRFGLSQALVDAGVELVDRMGYVAFIGLLLKSRGLITDGGSNQEESFYMGLPCLLMRKETERREGLGDNVMVSNLDPDVVMEFATRQFSAPWKLRSLPADSPSDMIAEELARDIK